MSRAPLTANFFALDYKGEQWLMTCKKCGQGYSIEQKEHYKAADLKYLIGHIKSHLVKRLESES
jgi:hypothetical protein